jgi:hypothetical protein
MLPVFPCFTNVVRTLFLHRVYADHVDKHGVSPEMPARDNGKGSTADVLREWLGNKDRDLREPGRGVGDEFGHGKRAPRALWIPSRGNAACQAVHRTCT